MHQSCFFLTSDGGYHFDKVVLDFDLDSALTFHKKEEYILTLSQAAKVRACGYFNFFYYSIEP